MAEPLKATFFALKRRDRMVLLPATLVMLVAVGLLFAAFVALNWGFFSQIQTLIQSGAEMPEGDNATFVFGIMATFFGGLLFLFPAYMVIAAYEAACLRWMVRGEVPGLFGLSFDHDMWRVYGVYWCWLIAQFSLSMVMGILMMPLSLMMMSEMVAASSEPTSDAWWSLQLRMQGLSLLQYIPLLYFGIRLGPAAATSIARKRFSFFDAWVVTRERFWALFGSHAVWVLILVVFWIAPIIYLFVVGFGGSWQAFVEGSSWQGSPEEAQERFLGVWERIATPAFLTQVAVGYAIMIATSVVWYLMSYGINARAALAALGEGKISVQASDD